MVRLNVPELLCAKLFKWLLVLVPARKVVTLDDVTSTTPPQASDPRVLTRLAETRDPEPAITSCAIGLVKLLATGLRGHLRFSALTVHDSKPLARSAPLHDIGKVGIPDGILHKPGIVSPEKWDGTGHLDDLAGEAFPLLARIMAGRGKHFEPLPTRAS